MAESASERRLAENEVVFRKLNQKFINGIADVNKLAAEDNQPEYLIKPDSDDEPLHFFCECSDDQCTMRIKLTLKDYTDLHMSKRMFVIVPGHDVPSIERIVIRHEPEYNVVNKFVAAPSSASKLHPTNLHNA